MTEILVNIGSGNSWWHKTITWTNADLASIGLCGNYFYMGEVTELRLSSYLVLLSIDSKAR